MSQRLPPSARQPEDEVPFGVRAIERGVEVKGVYISHSSTSDLIDRDVSTSSSLPHTELRSVDLEKQDSRPASSGWPLSRSPLENGLSTMPVGKRDASAPATATRSLHSGRDSSTSTTRAKRSRSRHPPSSYTRFTREQPPRSSSVSTFDRLQATHDASMRPSLYTCTDSDETSPNGSDLSGNDVCQIVAPVPMFLSGQATQYTQPSRSNSDFDLLDSHRISQAAETGQLAPRSRNQKPNISGETLTLNTSSTALADYLGAQGRLPSAVKPPSPPKPDALRPDLYRSSALEAQPFSQFCQTAPRPDLKHSQFVGPNSVPESTSVLPSSASEHEMYTSAPSSPLLQPEPTPPKAAEVKQTSFERVGVQVWRGHGSGFEVLKPGSFQLPEASEPDQPTGPPVSLHNVSERRRSFSSTDSRKKLQKKRRSSGNSRESSETSG